MNELLNKYKDCDMFSLTYRNIDKNIHIDKNEYLKALNNLREKDKEKLKKIYNKDFDKVYSEIEKECYEFNNEENKNKIINKIFNDKQIESFKSLGISDEKIEQIKENFFHVSFIVNEVGKSTKYDKSFIVFYRDISFSIDYENDIKNYNLNSGKNIKDILPESLKNNLLYYELSFYNEVVVNGRIMINYYFKLNEDTKKYLLQFKDDFDLEEFEDLTLFKDNKVCFASCTHEGFNSLNKEG